MTPVSTAGIDALATCFPNGRVTVDRMAAESGVPVTELLSITQAAEFPVLGQGETAWQLAARAGRQVLDLSGVEPAEITEVIFAGSGEDETPFWSPAAKVAAELGIEDAHAFEVSNFCNAAMTAVRIGCDRLAARGRGYALVLVGDQLSRMVDYGDPASKALFNFGDAAGAVLLTASDARFVLRHSAMRTDPSWADYYYGEHTKDGVVIRRGPHRSGLARAYVENFAALTESTLRAVDREISDVAYFLINHGDLSMHEQLLRALDIPPSRSVFNYARLGHMGATDTLIALRELADEKKLRSGDLVLMASSAMGFSWGITALEYQA